MRIALDAMGGDAAPAINIDGVRAALGEAAADDLSIVLVGPPDVVPEAMEAAGLPVGDDERVTFHASDGYVGMGEKPVEALRAKPNASIAVCWKMMAAGEVDAVVSAGNTGAVAAAGLRTKLYLRGVKRPGIAVPLPTTQGPCILMDAGANPGSSARHLAQYATMGAIYARAVFAEEKGADWQPRVGVLNIGGEVGKGTSLVLEAQAMIEADVAAGRLPGRYVGNVEGRELFGGEADVVVCDGFVGNVLLKGSEGLAALLLGGFAKMAVSEMGVSQDQAKQAIGRFSRRFSCNEVGGAPLLGIDGVCLIAHGSSDGTSIKNALLAAARIHAAGVNDSITAALT